MSLLLTALWSVSCDSLDGVDGYANSSGCGELVGGEVYDVSVSGVECVAYEWGVAGVWVCCDALVAYEGA